MLEIHNPSSNLDTGETGEIYTVSQLNRDARNILEQSFPAIWVEGEISNFVAPNSGHWYFSLKDEFAQVRCAMFKMQKRFINFQPQNGLHVLAKARVSLYEGRGDFQLIIEYMEEAGEGQLRKAFDILKKKLSDEGLFDTTHKKAIPSMPACVGVVTSATGAAIRDILNVLKRRFPSLKVIIYPTLVQGNEAAPQIVEALTIANQRKECDVIILARGGGSLEDLWPFNEEIVARAIFNSDIPIVTGVGHEIDFTIADFVSDLRAPTPSAAAELISPNHEEWIINLSQRALSFERHINQALSLLKQNLQWMKKNLHQQHPKRQLLERTQQIDLYETELMRLQTQLINNYQIKLHHLNTSIHMQSPAGLIQNYLHRLKLSSEQYQHSMLSQLNLNKQILANYAGKLDAFSPLATLTRGYAIATSGKKIIRYVKDVSKGDVIHLKLSDGSIDCEVK